MRERRQTDEIRETCVVGLLKTQAKYGHVFRLKHVAMVTCPPAQNSTHVQIQVP